MGIVSIQRTGPFLEWFILGVLIWYRSAPLLLSGALYLLLAVCAGLYSLYFASTLRVKQTTGRDELAWALHNRAYVLLLSGWQAAVLGLVNIWQFVPGSSVQVGLGYISVGVFIILS